MIKVLKSGLYAAVQDLGRYGYASSGVPVSGVMDDYSAKLANLLLGNDAGNAVIEITFGGSSFQFLKDTIICLSGANLKAQLNGEKLQLNHPVKVIANTILTFEKPSYGFRCYLAVKGGFLNKKVLGSRSYFKEVTKNFVLQKDDEVLYSEVTKPRRESLAGVKVYKEHFKSTTIEAFKGPEYELLTVNQRRILNTTEFVISSENSRMGYKLNEIIKNKIDSMLTAATMPGTVQLTPSGKLIILMRDCGVTGGYPRVLQLTDESINKIAQKSTEDMFTFKIVTI